MVRGEAIPEDFSDMGQLGHSFYGHLFIVITRRHNKFVILDWTARRDGDGDDGDGEIVEGTRETKKIMKKKKKEE